MKKCVSVLILLALASACAFAQLSLEGGIGISPKYDTTNVYEADLQKAIIIPTIGISYVMPNFDVLAGLELDLRQTTVEPKEAITTNKDSYWNTSIGIYGGIAPKFALSDKLTFSLPLLLKLTFGGESTHDYAGDRSVSASNTTGAGNSIFNLTITAGGRMSYAFAERFSFFTGLLIDVIALNTKETKAWIGPQVSNGTKVYSNTTNFLTFSKVSFPVGISFRF
jgi:hypothetical protein